MWNKENNSAFSNSFVEMAGITRVNCRGLGGEGPSPGGGDWRRRRTCWGPCPGGVVGRDPLPGGVAGRDPLPGGGGGGGGVPALMGWWGGTVSWRGRRRWWGGIPLLVRKLLGEELVVGFPS